VNPQSEITFSWVSNDNASQAFVEVGQTPGLYDLGNFSAAPPITYLSGDSCGMPSAWSHPGFFHHALLFNLTVGQRYYARAVQGSCVGAETSFSTAGPLGRESAVTALVFADMSESGGDGAVSTCQRLASRVNESDFALHVGDLSYGEGNVATWNSWMGLIEPIAAKIPYHVSIGNHVEWKKKNLRSPHAQKVTKQSHNLPPPHPTPPPLVGVRL